MDDSSTIYSLILHEHTSKMKKKKKIETHTHRKSFDFRIFTPFYHFIYWHWQCVIKQEPTYPYLMIIKNCKVWKHLLLFSCSLSIWFVGTLWQWPDDLCAWKNRYAASGHKQLGVFCRSINNNTPGIPFRFEYVRFVEFKSQTFGRSAVFVFSCLFSLAFKSHIIQVNNIIK